MWHYNFMPKRVWVIPGKFRGRKTEVIVANNKGFRELGFSCALLFYILQFIRLFWWIYILVCENSTKYGVALISDYFPITKRALFCLPSSILIPVLSLSNRLSHFSHLGSAIPSRWTSKDSKAIAISFPGESPCYIIDFLFFWECHTIPRKH